jgi:hypothetical protein
VCTRDMDVEPPTALAADRPAWEASESRDPRRAAAAVLCVCGRMCVSEWWLSASFLETEFGCDTIVACGAFRWFNQEYARKHFPNISQ